MKITQVLWKQHMGRMIKRNWFLCGKQVLSEIGSENVISKYNFEICDAKDVLINKPQFPRSRIDINELFKDVIRHEPLKKDENHPDWHEQPCLRYNNYDLLIRGTDQAQLLTKTLIVSDSLPEKIESLVEDHGEDVEEIVTGIIKSSNIFNAYQQKLPIYKDPLRPAYNFPRYLGITDVRKSLNLSKKMLQLCESLCGLEIAQDRQLLYDTPIELSIEKEGNILIFNTTMDIMSMSKSGLKPIFNVNDNIDKPFPNIYPLNSTISLQKDHFYQIKTTYPVSDKSPWVNLHTLFIYNDIQKVKNITELPVTKDQQLARTMIKSFVAAASCAKQKYGNHVTDLPEPITLQCVYTDSQSFNFSVFQLNTLNIDGIDGKCNYYWSTPLMKLYEKAKIEQGRPILTEYNPEVFKRILAFYKNS